MARGEQIGQMIDLLVFVVLMKGEAGGGDAEMPQEDRRGTGILAGDMRNASERLNGAFGQISKISDRRCHNKKGCQDIILIFKLNEKINRKNSIIPVSSKYCTFNNVFIKKLYMKAFNPSGINHITLRVNDIDRSQHFYGKVLGFRLEKKMGRSMVVYRIGDDSLVIVEAETSYDRESRDYRVDHFGFYVDSPQEVDAMTDYLKENEVTILSGPANRKTGRFVFISDPDGNMIEIFCENSDR